MPQQCKICVHPERSAIDAVLVQGHPSLRAIGEQYRVTKDSLLRHYRAHVADEVLGDPVAEDAPRVEAEPLQAAKVAEQKKSEEPRQGGEDSTVRNSEEPEDTEARYLAFIERWCKRVAIKADEMATWPEGVEGSRELLHIACARGDLFAIGDYYCATARQILHFRLSGSATCRL